VPFFANNEFRQFTFYGRFNRFSSGGNGEQGLIFNGNGPSTDCWPATIYVISVDSSHLTAGIVTDVDTYEITHSQEVNLVSVFSTAVDAHLEVGIAD
jgi:hypothetical protein